MSDYDTTDIRHAMEFLEALGELCEERGFVLDSHSEMFVERLHPADGERDLSRLFRVCYSDGYRIEEPIR